MYAIILRLGNRHFFAVSPYKTALKKWSAEIHKAHPTPAYDCAWELRRGSKAIKACGSLYYHGEFPCNNVTVLLTKPCRE